ncbi:glycoside hydrolase family 16 protein [Jejuia spongiicola]|uniref:Glycoside hydrolase family 16 protein n=1 Tax=Jejuia spongiicola TaxID=2942207 RepID=A0ABT0QGY9_9FLAO|nr:glycoside hydrolase family 16 protein [Jejuia spongiicola]MCL6295878.1 glycoside hydrolase family 16 protein [Jejuia spongiicola]
MRFSLLIVLLCVCFSTTYCAKSKSKSNIKFDTLVWSDEFNNSGPIDSTKWFHQTQIPAGGDWYGGLINHYTNRIENSYVEDGFLNIAARKEIFNDQGEIKAYTSARLNSKFAFTYGRVEVRAKMPTGVGTWPAIWMLNKNIDEPGAYWQKQGFGTTYWPVCGEIDILEHWGKKQNRIQSAVHTGASAGDDVVNLGGRVIENVSNQFHIYSLEWYENKMIFSVDDVVHYEYEPAERNSDTWPFTTDQYILLNIAIEPDIDPSFEESSMVVDYIRVYQ